jgi:glycosyltransferase involved in cell wall biosynthesis
MPDVSVVLPTYDRAPVLGRAIESVLSQTMEEFELIVVDDASTDHTKDVVSGFDDDRLRFVRHDTNRGGGAARNTGIEMATGKYVAFLDSDDAWEPTKLERQVACLESRSDEWIAVYCGVEYVNADQRPYLDILERGADVVRSIVPLADDRGYAHMGKEGGAKLAEEVLTLEFSVGGCSTLLVERSAIEAIGGFDTSIQRQEDLEVLIRLLREGKLAYVDADLVTKYEGSSPPPDVVLRERENFLQKFSEDVVSLELHGVDVVCHHRFAVALAYYQDGDFETGTKHLSGSRPQFLADYYTLLKSIFNSIGRR